MTDIATSQNLKHLLGQLNEIQKRLAHLWQTWCSEHPQAADGELYGASLSVQGIEDALFNDKLLELGQLSIDLRRCQNKLEGSEERRLERVRRCFALSPFEVDVLLLLLLPEVKAQFEAVYWRLQDDFQKTRPSVGIVLYLLCTTTADQLQARRCFQPDAPLLKNRLVAISEETERGLVNRTLHLDSGLLDYLLGEDYLDKRLPAPLVQLVDTQPASARQFMLSEPLLAQSHRLTRLAEKHNYLAVLLKGDEPTRQAVAEEVCHKLERPMLLVDIGVLAAMARPALLLQLIEREARLRQAVIYWKNYQFLSQKEEPAFQEVDRLIHQMLAEGHHLDFVATEDPLPPLLGGPERAEYYVQLAALGYQERQQLWESQLGEAASSLDLYSLSSRFRLNRGQIVAAVTTARNEAVWDGRENPTLRDLEDACRSHSNQRLSQLARKIVPRYSWDDLILPEEHLEILREICDMVKYRNTVYEQWQFDRKLSLGRGLNAIFAGPSGTGKTMSAEVIARQLAMDLYKIDLSQIVSKYIGETEKNLDKIFNEAGDSNAVLFFDEADSLFGKRSEVRDAHDRYANIETGYLLQKMEEYDGIVILATNLRKNLDEAFTRRMHFILEYPLPEVEDRRRIWQRSLSGVPTRADLDLEFMAQQFKLAGGNIKNIALAAAFLAAREMEQPAGTRDLEAGVGMVHLIQATRREFQKIGRICTEAEFGRYYKFLSGTR